MDRFLAILVFVLKHSARTLGRSASFLYYVRVGKRYGFPTCCTVHFALNVALRSHRKGRVGPAVKRGAIFLDPDNRNDCYVPCKFHVRRHPNWRAWNENDNLRQLRLFTMEPKR